MIHLLRRFRYMTDAFRIFLHGGISMSLVFQNLAGLQNRYPLNLWQELLGNCDVQYFLGCTDPLTAEFVSERTGLASVDVTSKAKQYESRGYCDWFGF